MSDNQSIRNSSVQASVDDYEYISNFYLGYFEDKPADVRLYEGVEYCLRHSYKDNKLNEDKFKLCYVLRKQLLEKADQVDMFYY